MAEDSAPWSSSAPAGDLAKRKLVPALWFDVPGPRPPEPFAVIGVARSEMSNEQFAPDARGRSPSSPASSRQHSGLWDRFAQALFYYTGDPPTRSVSGGCASTCAKSSKSVARAATVSFYCATAPSLYPPWSAASARRG